MWAWFMCLTEWSHGNNVLAVQFVYVLKICAKEPLRNYVIVFLDVPNGIGLNLFCYLWIKLLRLIRAWKFQKNTPFCSFYAFKILLFFPPNNRALAFSGLSIHPSHFSGIRNERGTCWNKLRRLSARRFFASRQFFDPAIDRAQSFEKSQRS